MYSKMAVFLHIVIAFFTDFSIEKTAQIRHNNVNARVYPLSRRGESNPHTVLVNTLFSLRCVAFRVAFAVLSLNFPVQFLIAAVHDFVSFFAIV